MRAAFVVLLILFILIIARSFLRSDDTSLPGPKTDADLGFPTDYRKTFFHDVSNKDINTYRVCRAPLPETNHLLSLQHLMHRAI